MEANLIREQLVKYLTYQIPVDALEEWIEDRTYNLHKQSRSEAKDLVRTVESKLFEFSGDYIPESALRESLAPLVTSYRAEADSDDKFLFESSNVIAEPRSGMGLWAADESPVMELSFA